MSSLAKQIEGYLKELIDKESAGVLEIQRSMLSEYFHCVPSQINYVLSTRFTPAQGYMVETRRGGGGYVRIVSLQFDDAKDLEMILTSGIGNEISERDEEGLLSFLVKEDLISEKEARLIATMLKDRVFASAAVSQKDTLRANMLHHLLAALSLEEY